MKNCRMFLFLAVACTFAVSGCVSSGKYQLKEQEATQLGSDLADLKQKYGALNKENDSLKSEVAKLKGNVAGLEKDKAKLTIDNKELNDLLKAKSDTLSKSITELRQKIADLEAENGRLKQEVANLQKVKEEEVKKVSKTLEEMTDKMKEQIAKGDLTIRELRGKLTVDMKAAVLFDLGKAEVKPEGIEVLNKMVDTFKSLQDKYIRIEGHTDNNPITGNLAKTYPTNWELSAARAINVTRYLQEQGVDPKILSAVAYGEYRPKPDADNNTREGQASNRRIEIILVNRDEPSSLPSAPQ
ncbi:putative 24.6 kDa protein in ccpA 3'region [Geobacter sp. OR-1]|uniref:OmpA family protein n=1 Tax=Geobacter sp. OR-1 TaxID=1266765 RepID=UPI000541D753|nr:OmpA family protein [Geobacter sp. OR-1]GAM09793.1 putative 24.6 kDa protein in ccpA 3'region [Geobacter sp. OR-1]